MRIASQNLWNVNPPLEERLSAFVALCHRYDPDVLLLQENSFSDALKTDVASAVAEQLRMNYRSHFHAGTWRGRDEGLAIVSRAQHIVELHVALSKGADGMGRCLACVTLPIGSKRLHLANTHLAHYLNDNTGRVVQTQQVCEALQRLMSNGSDDYLVLGGDLNCSPHEEPAQRLRNGIVPLVDPLGERESAETWTYRTDNPYAVSALGPDRRIDYLFVSPGLRCVRAEVLSPVMTGLAPWSDHSAVLIEI